MFLIDFESEISMKLSKSLEECAASISRQKNLKQRYVHKQSYMIMHNIGIKFLKSLHQLLLQLVFDLTACQIQNSAIQNDMLQN